MSQAPEMSEEAFAVLPQPGGDPAEVHICYQTFGDPSDRPLLLVMGLGGPMTWWPVELCRRLAGAGFYVIRYDNRDTGHSTRFRGRRVTRKDLVRAFFGRRIQVPYSLRDMARDAVGLLDHLGIDAAHVAGVSMGGMIAQTLAVEHPDRVLSLTSIMSSVGARTSGYQHPILLPGLLRRAARTKEQYVAGTIAYHKLIGSPDFPTSDEELRAQAEETWDRGINPAGVMRQMVAVLTQRNRTRALGSVRIPVTVVHGTKVMVHISGGRATAKAARGARLVEVPGMGHDIAPGLYDTFVDAITSTAERAGSSGPVVLDDPGEAPGGKAQVS
jgi:pimeloyl-ACP methyl ester carboxylesterase